ncbi:MAG: sensor histidine kinase [Sandaracinaceae bacterium]
MRLLPRLILAQSVPLAILTVAVALIVASLTRVTDALGQLRTGELTALRGEADVHRAGWAVDVALRHAAGACSDAPTSDRAVGDGVASAARELETITAEVPDAHPELIRLSRGYLALAARVALDPSCATVTSTSVQRERSILDEDLTNAWVARTRGLHDSVIAREEETQAMVRATLIGALLLGGLAALLAFAVSLALVRSITTPLAALTEEARRLGGGELEEPVRGVGGAPELVEFASELEAMRGRLAELDMLKQGFIASCSHELRTPLSKLREALALLADGAVGTLSAAQLRVVAIARGACERQIRTVSSILDLSRLRAGTPLRLRGGVRPSEVIAQAVALEREDADARGIAIEIAEPDEDPGRADLDDGLLEHAIANLVRNAVSVSEKGQEVRVRQRVERDASGASMTIEVEDDGPGVPAELEHAIFRPFVTHAPTSSPKRVGVGLGLALAREVAEAHGGELTLVRPERGSLFRFRIPLRRTLPTAEVAS